MGEILDGIRSGKLPAARKTRGDAHVVLGEECLRLNPADGTIASRVPAMRANDARKIANRAALAFAGWSRMDGADRAAILRRAAGLIGSRHDELAALMRDEIGATPAWQAFNLDQAAWQFRQAADLAESFQTEIRPDQNGQHLIFREPAGVCLGIAPWNAPLALGTRAIATALACGNAVILKASEICAGSHLAIGRILSEAGLPEGVLSIVTHAPEHAEEVVQALIAHEVVRRVNFTGSTRVGRKVAELAAVSLKRCLLELSGKAALIVLEDADLPAAADAAIYGAFLNQGQICMSTDRIIVLDAVADRFAALLTERARMLHAGPPEEGAPLGPVVSEAAAERLQTLVAEAVARGAELLCGGGNRGTFMDATLLDHVEPGTRLYSEEIFGPVLSICRAANEAEALSIANDSRYGLSAAVWSRDIARATRLARQIESGMCHINAPTLMDRPDMPVGGIKESGYGRFGGFAALDEFTELRWVAVGNGAVRQPR
ncbi:aldehyde dehydrogenase family protein [Paracoccus cavernae]|uniref:Aldehyde dehydrogenase family protein n=1 Tax=Paracoccus cavernae TaxID=1571207 RepID=A0ABT8DAL9_9RHOB|nr:aldehyde dehydrogenase family protein [Paracoccus cavernae]